MATLLDKAWNGAKEAFGLIYGDDDDSKALVNYSGTNLDIPVAYGDEELPAIWLGFRVGGKAQFSGFAVFCYAPIEGVDWVKINGEKFTLVDDSRGDHSPQRHTSKGIKFALRIDGQGAQDSYKYFTDNNVDGDYPLPSDLGTGSPIFFEGLVGAWFDFNIRKGVVAAIPDVTIKVRGRNHLFDPRIDAEPGVFNRGTGKALVGGSTTTASTNNALIHADYLTNKWYGKGLSWDRINIAALSAAADICDTQVLDGDGATIPLMEFNGRLDTSQKIDKNLELIEKHMRAHAPYHNKQFSLVIRDDVATPDLIPEKWIEKHYEISHGEKSGRLNSCLVTYREPAYELDDNQVIWPGFDSAESLSYLEEDGGEILQEEVTLSGCRNRYQAIDYAEAIVRESRLQIETKLKLLAKALKYQAGDVVDVPLKGLGVTRMRIVSVEIHDDLNVTWSLLQHSNDSYPWTTKSAIPLPAKNESNPLIVAAPLNVAFTPDVYNEFSSGVLSWDEIDHTYAFKYAVSITNTDTGILVASYTVEDVQTKIQNLASGNYSFSVRALINLANGPATVIAVQITNPLIETISNFRILEGGTEFTGLDCSFRWTAPGNAAFVVHEYVVQILHATTQAELFTDTTTSPFYTFTHPQNALAGLHRTFKIKVFARGKYGQDNKDTGAVELTVNNPLPGLPSGVVYSSTQATITLKFNPIPDTDFKTVKVWLSESSGFSAIDGQQAFTTQGNQIEFDGLTANTPYYLRYSVLDEYHADTDVGPLSGELVIYTAPDALLEATNALARGEVLTDLSAIENLILNVEGAHRSEEIIVGNAKVKRLTEIKDDQIIEIDQLKVADSQKAAAITALQQVDINQASSLTQVQVTQGMDKSELQGNIDAAKATASDALTAMIGYCTIGGHSTQTACEGAGGTWNEEPLALALLNAKLVLPGGAEISAGAFFETLSNNGALSATAGLTVDVNGTVTGIVHGANSTSSKMVLSADIFEFETSSGTIQPLRLNGDAIELINVLIKSGINVNGNFIVDDQGKMSAVDVVLSGQLIAPDLVGGFGKVYYNQASSFYGVPKPSNYVYEVYDSGGTGSITDVPLATFYLPPIGGGVASLNITNENTGYVELSGIVQFKDSQWTLQSRTYSLANLWGTWTDVADAPNIIQSDPPNAAKIFPWTFMVKLFGAGGVLADINAAKAIEFRFHRVATYNGGGKLNSYRVRTSYENI